MEDKNSSRWWVYPPNCRTKVGARWSPSFPRQSLACRRARNIVQVHAHALNGSWECYHVVRIGLGAIWGDHGRRRSLHFTTPPFCLEKGWIYPLLSISQKIIKEKVWQRTPPPSCSFGENQNKSHTMRLHVKALPSQVSVRLASV